MRNMSRFWRVLIISMSLGVTLFWTTIAKAGPLNIATTDWSTFSSNYLGSQFMPPIVDYFDFSPSTIPADGEIFSVVYQGAGLATGKYVYLYQLNLYKTSSAGFMSGIAFDFLTTLPPSTIGGYEVYQFPDPGIGFGVAKPNTKLSDAIWTPATTSTSQVSFYIKLYRDDNDGGLHDPPGDTDPPYEDTVSYMWAFFHPLPPTKISANPKDGGPDLLEPLVYTPSPEPSNVVLLSLGLLGLIGIKRRYLV